MHVGACGSMYTCNTKAFHPHAMSLLGVPGFSSFCSTPPPTLDTSSSDADWNQSKPVRDSSLGWSVWPSGRPHSTHIICSWFVLWSQRVAVVSRPTGQRLSLVVKCQLVASRLEGTPCFRWSVQQMLFNWKATCAVEIHQKFLESQPLREAVLLSLSCMRAPHLFLVLIVSLHA